VTKLRVAQPPEPPPLADREEVQQLARGLTDGALHCREHRRHNWRPSTVTREEYGFRRIETCPDCGCSRWQELDSRGYVVRGGMTYSEGYLNPPGTGRVGLDGIAAYRLEAIDRLIGKRKSVKVNPRG